MLRLVGVNLLLISLFMNRPAIVRTDPCAWPCPLPSDIAPCTCFSDGNFYTFLNCDSVASDAELELALTPEMPFYDFKLMNITKEGSGTNLFDLTFSVFYRVSFQDVIIHGTSLQRISDAAFVNSQNTLETLKLDHNNINFFVFEVLNLYNALSLLDLSFNNLTKINKISSDSITYLDFSYNLGVTIDADTFTACSKLGFIDLSVIGLKDIPDNIFYTNPLSEIRLSGNQLSTLRPNAIHTGSGKLMKLYLENNLITQIDVDSIQNMDPKGNVHMANNKINDLLKDNWFYLFNTLTNNQSIDLAGNDLTCGCEMEWLFTDDVPLVFKLTDQTKCHDGTQTNTIDPKSMMSLCNH